MSTGRLPTFVIAGFPKSGTTALATYLAAHPDIYFPPELGVYFFGMNFDRGLDWYRSRFEAADGVAHVGETSPGYAIAEEAFERMAETLPDAKIILALRNPVERAHSHYWMQRSKFPDRRTFGDVVAEQIDHPERKPPPPHLPYLRMGHYFDHVQRILSRYPREAVHLVLFEDLVSDPKTTTRAVCRFLGASEEALPEGVGDVVNQTRPVRSERVRRAMLRLRIGKWLPGRVALALDGFNRKPESYPKMDPRVRERLVRYYAQDVDRLARWLGRDLSAWTR